MPSHYSTLGFEIETAEDLAGLAERLLPSCRQINVKRGRYLVWSSGSGAELWLQINRRNELVGAQPHFAGTSSLPVRIAERVRRENDTELDGGFHVWLKPESGASYDEYPFVFDCVNFNEFVPMATPGTGTVQLTAFAHEISAFASAAEFDASQSTEYKFAPESFVPSGTFVEAGPPESMAMFAGEVIAAEQKMNELSGTSFVYCSVRTLSAIVDVVVDRSLLHDPPAAGSIVFGTYWLSGRLLSFATTASLRARLWHALAG